jgi:general secretion pathway protein D
LSTGTSVVTGNVTYQDVGLKLEFEPQVYANQEVGLKVNLEVSNIVQAFTDSQGGRSYQIGTRNAATTLRLKDGETQVLGGLISDEDRNVASLIPGLGHLPVVGKLFGNNEGTSSRSEIVLAITPRIVRESAPTSPETRVIFSGTANGLRDRPIMSEPIKVVKLLDKNGVAGSTTQGSASAQDAAAPTPPTSSQVAPVVAPPAVSLPAPPPMINRNPVRAGS